MLTPSKHDTNRKTELKRKKESPDDFGVTTVSKLPKDHQLGKGLVKASNDVTEDVEDKAPALTPEDEAALERKAMITEALGKLEEDNKKHYDKDGVIILKALEKLTNLADITADEVGEIIDEMV